MFETLKRRFLGRSGRGEYWLLVVGLFVANFILGLIISPVLASLVSLPFWLFIAGRRLHDFNARVGWAFIPAVTGFVLGFVKGFAESAGFAAPYSDSVQTVLMLLLTLAVTITIGSWPPSRGENRFGPARALAVQGTD